MSEKMTSIEFKKAQKRLGLSNHKIADWLGVHVSSIQKWRSGAVAIPGPAVIALKFILNERSK